MKKGLFRKKFLAGLIILLTVAFAGSTALAHELDDIRAAIHERDAHWVAGETSVSKLPQHERQLRLGHVKHRLTGDETLLTSAGSTGSGGSAAAYTSFDWTYPTSYVTPVRNQGNCGSCWAFATTAALESYSLIKNSLPGQELNLAEQVMVSCGGAGSCGGGYVGSAANYIKSTGLPREECYTYTATNGTCSTACYNWQSNSYKIAGWGYVATTAPTVDAIKNALVTYGPLVTTFEVYSDFFSYVSGIYQHTSGTYQGGHAVLIVGFDDTEQSFKVKNSWGTGWGEAGYFRIAYSELTSAVGFGEYTIAYTGSAPQPPPPSPDPQPTTCTYTLSPTSKTFTDKGGKGSLSVTTGAGCAWTASESADWVSITSGASKTGSGTVNYTVTSNATTTTRATSIGINAPGTSSTMGTVSIIEKGKRR
jgi:C1A family cysteine protease